MRQQPGGIPRGRRGAVGAQARRQIAQGDFLTPAKHHGMFDCRAQLTDVARPAVFHQRFERFGGKIVHFFVVLPGELAQKILRQQWDVPRPLAQRRQPDFHDFQPEVKVFTERTGFDQFLQIFVRGGDQPHVRRQRLAGTDALERALAEEAQQFDLDRGVNFADFIQKQRPALRLLDASDPPLMRAGERSFLVPEQLALNQFPRQTGAVHGHQRLPRPRAELMQGPGDQLLAGAAFPGDEHGGLGRRDLAHRLQNLLHRRRFADDIFQPVFFVQLLPQRLVFNLERLMPQRPGNPHFQLVNLHPPFGNVVVGPVFHRLHRDFLRAVSGHQDADGRFGKRLRPRDQFHAVLAGEAKVRQQHVEMFLLQQFHRRAGVSGKVNVVTVLQYRAQPLSRRFFIIHDEQHRFNHAGAPPTIAAAVRAAAARSETWFPAPHDSPV